MADSFSNEEVRKEWHDVLWSNKDIDLMVSDGTFRVPGRYILFSSFLWEPLFEWSVPVTSKCILDYNLGLSEKTYNKLQTNVFRELHEKYKDDPNYMNPNHMDSIFENICMSVLRAHNKIFGFISSHLGAYVSSCSILEMIDVLDNEKINNIMTSMELNQSSIDETYDRVRHELLNSETLDKTHITLVTRCGIVDPDQLMQSLVARGYCTEINSERYPEPVGVGYLVGMRSLIDAAMESRSASKSQMFQKDPLADCEYFNRKLQLSALYVDKLYRGDCGSPHTLAWKVERAELKNLVGMNYYEHTGGPLKTIKETDKHLIGQTINLRTPLTCSHSDRQTVCSTCVGDLAYSIPINSSPGFISSVLIGERISQLVLKVKHVDGSGRVTAVILEPEYKGIMDVSLCGSGYRISNKLRKQSVYIKIKKDYARSLPDLINIPDLDNVQPSMITEAEEVTILYGDPSVHMEEVVVPVSMGNRLGSFTKEALIHIMQVGYSSTDDDHYLIDFTKFNRDETLFSLPLKYASMLDFKNSVQRYIMSNSKFGCLSRSNGPVEAIKNLNKLLSSKVNVNIVHQMILALAYTAVNPRELDYRMVRGGEPIRFSTLDNIMAYGSAGAMMAYETQKKVFIKPEFYIDRKVRRHRLDNLLMGQYNEITDNGI